MAAPWWAFALTAVWGFVFGWLGVSVRDLRRRVRELEARPTDQDLQMDIASVVGRLEQIGPEGWEDHPVVAMRLHTCDVPRLRRHLTDEMQAMLDEYR